ncbi:UNVERIFIED_CONTAM: hypothetical protein FKN15_028785 [Acipenser sinensis]
MSSTAGPKVCPGVMGTSSNGALSPSAMRAWDSQSCLLMATKVARCLPISKVPAHCLPIQLRNTEQVLIQQPQLLELCGSEREPLTNSSGRLPRYCCNYPTMQRMHWLSPNHAKKSKVCAEQEKEADSFFAACIDSLSEDDDEKTAEKWCLSTSIKD